MNHFNPVQNLRACALNIHLAASFHVVLDLTVLYVFLVSSFHAGCHVCTPCDITIIITCGVGTNFESPYRKMLCVLVLIDIARLEPSVLPSTP